MTPLILSGRAQRSGQALSRERKGRSELGLGKVAKGSGLAEGSGVVGWAVTGGATALVRARIESVMSARTARELRAPLRGALRGASVPGVSLRRLRDCAPPPATPDQAFGLKRCGSTGGMWVGMS